MLEKLLTEQANPASAGIDSRPTAEILRIINDEDAQVAPAVAVEIPRIAQAVDAIVEAIRAGGRVFYAGAGTSGRLGVLDAAECPPTFGVPPDLFQGVIAGGEEAMARSTEASEDDTALAVAEIKKREPGRKDIVLGIATSGRTPFTISAIQHARARGARTVAVVCNPKSPLGKAAHLAIVAEVGAEVVAGSTRMKAGTAQKMILNMLSTGAMTRLGYVYGNLMVNVHPKNAKLAERGVGILEKAAGLNRRAARKLLAAAGGRVPVALLMAKAGVRRDQAVAALNKSQGQVRQAMALAKRRLLDGDGEKAYPQGTLRFQGNTRPGVYVGLLAAGAPQLK